MSTHAHVGYLTTKDDLVIFAYCHFDGAYDFLGKELIKYVSNSYNASKLIDLGSFEEVCELASTEVPKVYPWETQAERTKKLDDFLTARGVCIPYKYLWIPRELPNFEERVKEIIGYDFDEKMLSDDGVWLTRVGRRSKWFYLKSVVALTNFAHNIKLFDWIPDFISNYESVSDFWATYYRCTSLDEALDNTRCFLDTNFGQDLADGYLEEFEEVFKNGKLLLPEKDPRDLKEWSKLERFIDELARDVSHCKGTKPELDELLKGVDEIRSIILKERGDSKDNETR